MMRHVDVGVSLVLLSLLGGCSHAHGLHDSGVISEGPLKGCAVVARTAHTVTLQCDEAYATLLAVAEGVAADPKQEAMEAALDELRLSLGGCVGCEANVAVHIYPSAPAQLKDSSGPRQGLSFNWRRQEGAAIDAAGYVGIAPGDERPSEVAICYVLDDVAVDVSKCVRRMNALLGIGLDAYVQRPAKRRARPAVAVAATPPPEAPVELEFEFSESAEAPSEPEPEAEPEPEPEVTFEF